MLKKVLTVSLVLSLISIVGVWGIAQSKVTIAVLWTGTELEAFKKTLIPFEQETGIDVIVEEVG
ncbi:hypothetical protein KAX17_13110, partial [Candidatus Bipolaricaulota bacterium]|nr:hypothetical protein [Candidatus Bipolaricaulota bacterium]